MHIGKEMSTEPRENPSRSTGKIDFSYSLLLPLALSLLFHKVVLVRILTYHSNLSVNAQRDIMSIDPVVPPQ